jgi:anti-anti-sigma factor
MNNEDTKKLPYLRLSTYSGQDKLYNIIKIEVETMDRNTGPIIRDSFCQYFYHKYHKELGGNENNVLDLSQVRHMDSSGLSTLLTFERLNETECNKAHIKIINCQTQIQRLISISQLDTLVNVVERLE